MKRTRKLSDKYRLIGWHPDHVIEGVLTDLGAGMGITKVAAKSGVDRSLVSRWLKKAVRLGYLPESCQPVRKRPRPPQRVTRSQIADMLELTRAGVGDNTAGRVVGCSGRLVRYYRGKAGLPSNDTRRFYQAGEVEALLALRSDGMYFSEIAARLGRSAQSVWNKYHQLTRRGLHVEPRGAHNLANAPVVSSPPSIRPTPSPSVTEGDGK